MPELGATEDLTALIPGNPVVLRTAGATYRRYALTLEDASAGLARVGTPEGWSGPAADGFRAAFAPEPRRWQDAAAAFGEAARAADDHATALELGAGSGRRGRGPLARGAGGVDDGPRAVRPGDRRRRRTRALRRPR